MGNQRMQPTALLQTVLICLACCLAHGASAEKNQVYTFSSSGALHIETLKREVLPIALYLQQHQIQISVTALDSIEQLVRQSQSRPFDLMLTSPAIAYNLINRFDYRAILKTKVPVQYKIIQNKKSTPDLGDQQKSDHTDAVIYTLKNDIHAEYIQSKMYKLSAFEKQDNIENLLISVLRNHQSKAITSNRSLHLLPENLRAKIHMTDIKETADLILLCHRNEQKDCDGIASLILNFFAERKRNHVSGEYIDHFEFVPTSSNEIKPEAALIEFTKSIFSNIN